MSVKRFYRRNETLPLQAVAIQVVGARIGRGDQRYAALEQTMKQSPQYHCITDIAYEKLVETQHAGFSGHVARDCGERVLDIIQGAESLVYVFHDAVEVHAAL